MKDNKTVSTIENEDWFLKMKKESKSNVMASQNVSSVQLFLRDKDYYKEVSTERRGQQGEVYEKPKYYDICTIRPTIGDPESIKEAALLILREKCYNDMRVYNKLFEELKKDKIIEDDIEILKEDVENMFNIPSL